MVKKTRSFRLISTLGIMLSGVMFGFSLASKANAQIQTYPIPSQMEIVIGSTNGIIDVTTIDNPCNPALPATVVRLDRVTCNIQTTPSFISIVAPNLLTRCYIDFGNIFPNMLYVSGTCSYEPFTQTVVVF